jgi:hypothetical protein
MARLVHRLCCCILPFAVLSNHQLHSRAYAALWRFRPRRRANMPGPLRISYRQTGESLEQNSSARAGRRSRNGGRISVKFWKDFAAVLIILSLCRTTNCVFNPVPWEPGWMSIRRDFLRSGGFAVTLGFHEFEGN